MADKKIVAGIFATIVASLCCVTPVLALLAGSSSLASSFSWMEPYHNYLVGLTILILAYAWWEKLAPKKVDIDCACDENTKIGFFSGKTFLAIVTIFAIAMLSFPQWGGRYFQTNEACGACSVDVKKEESANGNKEAKKALPVLNYMKENSAACSSAKACSGIGYKEADKLLSDARAEVQEMAPSILKKMLDNGEDVILLDIREPSQRAEGEIYADKSYAVARGDLEFEIMNKIKDKYAIIVVYCRSGGRSVFAAQTLKHLGYKNSYNLQGGLKGWARAGLPFDNGLGTVTKVEEE